MTESLPHFIGVTGLPRAGSTLLCQLLAQHPDIASDGRSSALCNSLLAIRRTISDDTFFLSHLDRSFDETYGRLQAAMSGFLRGWLGGVGKAVVADKNRAWLHSLDMLLRLAPEAKLLVCVRDLGQICGSIEDQHQNTVLLDFADHLADYDRLGRADQLFAKDRVIGAALTSLSAVQDMPQEQRDRLFFVRFEDLISNPVGCMEKTFAWIGVPPLKIDPNNLTLPTPESDSHYRGKYPHGFKTRIEAPRLHAIPARTQALIETGYDWYYQAYYPDRMPKSAS